MKFDKRETIRNYLSPNFLDFNFRFPGLLIYNLPSPFCHDLYDKVYSFIGFMTIYDIYILRRHIYPISKSGKLFLQQSF